MIILGLRERPGGREKMCFRCDVLYCETILHSKWAMAAVESVTTEAAVNYLGQGIGT